MDNGRFDELTRACASTSRRQVLRQLVGATIGALVGLGGSRVSQAASCRAPGSVCREHANCCSGTCGPKNRQGQRVCACTSPADCPAPRNKCQTASCTNGVCGGVNAVTCTTLDQCHVAGVCDQTTGKCSNPPKPNDTTCDDGDACTENDTCQNGTCEGTPKSCPPCQRCRNGACQAVLSDNRCDGVCANGTCVAACLALRADCDETSNTCCQDEPTDCSREANCFATEGTRCCRPFGAVCGGDCDCCSNANCVNGICGLEPGQQCLDSSECVGGTCCNGICRALATDPTNCGTCGTVCPAPPPGGVSRCVNGQCSVECTGGRTLCFGVCRDLDSDELNCGACNNACGPNETCCFGTCKNLQTDERNCGICNLSCGFNETCCNGTCTDLTSDVTNCGACGTVCGGSTPDCCNGCTSLDHDINNCGVCGLRCPTIDCHTCQGSLCKADSRPSCL